MPALTPQQGGAVLLLYDVTDLVRLDEMRSELVAVASHELQTPLTTLRMTLLMLQEASDVLPERQRELVATSLIGVEQLTETVHEFLDLTRIEAGELRLNLEPVHVSAVIADALRRVEGQAKAQGIALVAHLDTDLAADLGRPSALASGLRQHPLECAQIHARRRTRDRRESSHRRGSRGRTPMVSISVVDTGPGIPVAFRSRVSTSSFDSNTTRATRVQGHEELALACTCAGRSSSCTAARSRAARVPMGGHAHHREPAGQERRRRSRRESMTYVTQQESTTMTRMLTSTLAMVAAMRSVIGPGDRPALLCAGAAALRFGAVSISYRSA